MKINFVKAPRNTTPPPSNSKFFSRWTTKIFFIIVLIAILWSTFFTTLSSSFLTHFKQTPTLTCLLIIFSETRGYELTQDNWEEKFSLYKSISEL